MPGIPQGKADKGSQYWLQVLVNQHRDMVNHAVQSILEFDVENTITWLSPLEKDDYAEYRDDAFLKRLSIQLTHRALDSFWPNGGPVWDGLGRSNSSEIILVEAKSHINELKSSCKAKPDSRSHALIQESLLETARFYGATNPGNWLDGYYQYANRLAHLHLLRQLNHIPAWLVFVYFVNDVTMHGPKSEDEWHAAIDDIHRHLGLTEEQLAPYVRDVFVDVTKIEEVKTVTKALGI